MAPFGISFGSSDDEDDAAARNATAQAVLRDVTAPFVDRDLATLRSFKNHYGDPLSLEPKNPSSAAISVAASEGPWIDVTIGGPYPRGLGEEIFCDDGWPERLRNLIAGVVDNGCVERRYRTRFGFAQSMSIETDDGVIELHHSGPAIEFEPDQLGETRYEPYRRQ